MRWMPYRILCNGELLEGTKASPSLASKLSCYMPLHNNFYGIMRWPEMFFYTPDGMFGSALFLL